MALGLRVRACEAKKYVLPNTTLDAFGNAIGNEITTRLQKSDQQRPSSYVQGTENESAAETRRLLGYEFNALPSAQQKHMQGLAERANVDPFTPSAFLVLREASETQMPEGQDLISSEIQQRTNAYLSLAGATEAQISEINNAYKRRRILQSPSGRATMYQNEDGSPVVFSSSSSSSGANINLFKYVDPPSFVIRTPIDNMIIGTGGVLKEFGGFVESNPLAKYTLMGLDVASGPAIYAVRNFTPVGDLANAANEKVAGIFEDGFKGVGRTPEEAEDGGVGGTSMLSMAAGGFLALARGGWIVRQTLKEQKAQRAAEIAALNAAREARDAERVVAKAAKAANSAGAAADGVVASRVNVRTGHEDKKGSGIEYAWKKHGGNWGSNKSAFTIPKSELTAILQSPTVVNAPAYYSKIYGNYVRIVEMEKPIGIDAKGTKMPTNIMTVITDADGNLVNTFPGKV